MFNRFGRYGLVARFLVLIQDEIKLSASRKEQEIWFLLKEMRWRARAQRRKRGMKDGDIAINSASRAEIWRGDRHNLCDAKRGITLGGLASQKTRALVLKPSIHLFY